MKSQKFYVSSTRELARLLPVTHRVQRTSAQLELMFLPSLLLWVENFESAMYPSDSFGLRAGI